MQARVIAAGFALAWSAFAVTLLIFSSMRGGTYMLVPYKWPAWSESFLLWACYAFTALACGRYALTTAAPPAPRAKLGMTIEEVREIYRIRSETKTKEIMNKYYQLKAGRSGGRGGLSIYDQYRSRARDAVDRIARQLLKSAGLPLTEKNWRELRRRS